MMEVANPSNLLRPIRFPQLGEGELAHGFAPGAAAGGTGHQQHGRYHRDWLDRLAGGVGRAVHQHHQHAGRKGRQG